MSSSTTTVLPQSVGYGVVVGVGFFFAAAMMVISTLQNRYTAYSTKTNEEFNTASRSVKPGLIAAGIVSAWTWAATLLQSSTVAFNYGLAGPFWCEYMNQPRNLGFEDLGGCVVLSGFLGERWGVSASERGGSLPFIEALGHIGVFLSKHI